MGALELMFLNEKHELRTDFEKLRCLCGAVRDRIKLYLAGAFVFVDDQR